MIYSGSIIFVTGNSYKLEIARKVLGAYGIGVVQKELETPEVQSENVAEIASYSARWACRQLGRPVALTDAGYFIKALNGFPGPFIKYINRWLSAGDILKMMEGKNDRTVVVRACLAYCEPGKEPLTFDSSVSGIIANEAIKTAKPGTTAINEIFIPEGFDKVESEIPRENMVSFWAKVESYWEKLAEYLQNKDP